MRLRIVTGLVTAGILTAGCGSGKTADPTPSKSSTTPTTATALTEAQARKIFTTYQKVNNQANSHLSAKLLSSIETGPMLKSDLIDYKITRAGDEPKIKMFNYRSPHFYIPRTTGTPWFAVDAKSTLGGEEFLVFVQSGGTYKLTTSAWKSKEAFPSIALGPDGSATAVTGGATTQIAASHSQYLTTTAAGLRGDGFAPGASTTQLGKAWEKNVVRITEGGTWQGGTSWKPRTDRRVRAQDDRRRRPRLVHGDAVPRLSHDRAERVVPAGQGPVRPRAGPIPPHLPRHDAVEVRRPPAAEGRRRLGGGVLESAAHRERELTPPAPHLCAAAIASRAAWEIRSTCHSLRPWWTGSASIWCRSGSSSTKRVRSSSGCGTGQISIERTPRFCSSAMVRSRSGTRTGK